MTGASSPRSQPALYDARFEHEACGVGFLVHQKGEASHEIVDRALKALERMEHRGATGAEPETGDGAGIQLQIPDRLFSRECALGRIAGTEPGQSLRELPPAGQYAAGLFFGSPDPQATALAKMIFAMIVRQEGQTLLGWRRVPTDNRSIGATARSVEPTMDHVLIAPPNALGADLDHDAFERKLYVIKKRFQNAIRTSGIDDRRYFHVPSLSARTLTYKGMLTPNQLREYFSDLDDPRTESALAMFHSRFSTNTFPSWELAHPYRFIAHNGEINTLRGNINWMRAREALLASPLFDDLSKVLPVAEEGLSDSACLDSVIELLVMAGRSLPHAVMMLIPEAWEHDASMSAAKKAFYAYHGCLVEPWDGPACVCFTDGRQIGAVLDRNGLRPARYCITKSGLIMLASEVGVLSVSDEDIVQKGRVEPGRMFLVDLEAGRVISDDEVKTGIATALPYGDWLAQNLVHLEALPEGSPAPQLAGEELLRAQQTFGMTEEDLRLILAPMATKGEEGLGSMGNDAALAVLSSKPRPLADYFQQLFAQVTNPPLDAIREDLVTSVTTAVGPEGNLLDPRPESCRLVLCKSPFLDADAMAKFKALTSFERADDLGRSRAGATAAADAESNGQPFLVTVLDMVFPAREGPEGLEPALLALFAKADNAIANGSKVLVLSDRRVDESSAPIPSLLATAGLQNHLVRTKKRTQVTVIVEAGDAREVHHFATLIGYGASAVHPYLALDSLPGLFDLGLADAATGEGELAARYLKAVEKGVVKVMSKMGISTIASYRGAQIFEAVGIAQELVDRYFTLTPSRVGGIGIRDIASDILIHHDRAYASRESLTKTSLPVVTGAGLDVGGQYQWRRDGEIHLFSPQTIFKLQHATRAGRYEIFKEYTREVDEHAAGRVTLRSLLGFSKAATPIPIDEVEPIEAILPRFQTGAMSYGSISAEAHETLAIAMNRIGAKSNSGEGGEDPRRFVRDANGDSRRSAIKQVASARFGVTSEYLVNADELQIKMAQGAKPGEGGQLPGTKVVPWIAEVRHSTPGVGLISPPPHHDIYSIEDLAELIYDLKNANPRARVSVKLVAEVGVGTVAAGVAKAKSDAILISGHDGGTGASPLTSLKHAGVPWELGLAEAQQTLVMNRLRDRVSLAVDGQLRTGRDVVIAALLGAEEFGFATAPLVVMGCVMMRVCHLDTCPVGIATQNPALREKFSGRAEHVVSFFRFVAQEVREIMASLGARSLDELIGRVDLLEAQGASQTERARGVDLSKILDQAHLAASDALPKPTLRKAIQQRHGLEAALDNRLVAFAEPALSRSEPVFAELVIENVHRAVGTMLGSEVTRRYGARGLPDDTIRFTLRGSAGQSFGAFVPRGISLRLEGDANDYVGKGLSGGTIVVTPAAGSGFVAEENVIAGNVLLYGATGGEAFVRGVVGERFAVRNSGARAVVEGVGDHGCEYMTGGTVAVLGRIGRNFAAGMSGGVAYVRCLEGEALRGFENLRNRVNPSMVEVEPLDDDDLRDLEGLLRRHAQLTSSAIAKALLDDVATLGDHFARVLPHDERRARAERQSRTVSDTAPRADAAE